MMNASTVYFLTQFNQKRQASCVFAIYITSFTLWDLHVAKEIIYMCNEWDKYCNSGKSHPSIHQLPIEMFHFYWLLGYCHRHSIHHKHISIISCLKSVLTNWLPLAVKPLSSIELEFGLMVNFTVHVKKELYNFVPTRTRNHYANFIYMPFP